MSDDPGKLMASIRDMERQQRDREDRQIAMADAMAQERRDMLRAVRETPALLARLVALAEAQLAEQRITNDLLRRAATPPGGAPPGPA